MAIYQACRQFESFSGANRTYETLLDYFEKDDHSIIHINSENGEELSGCGFLRGVQIRISGKKDLETEVVEKFTLKVISDERAKILDFETRVGAYGISLERKFKKLK